MAAPQHAGSINQLPLPLAYSDRVNGVVGADLLDCFLLTDRLHGDSGLERAAVGAVRAHWWALRSGG